MQELCLWVCQCSDDPTVWRVGMICHWCSSRCFPSFPALGEQAGCSLFGLWRCCDISVWPVVLLAGRLSLSEECWETSVWWITYVTSHGPWEQLLRAHLINTDLLCVLAQTHSAGTRPSQRPEAPRQERLARSVPCLPESRSCQEFSPSSRGNSLSPPAFPQDSHRVVCSLHQEWHFQFKLYLGFHSDYYTVIVFLVLVLFVMWGRENLLQK